MPQDKNLPQSSCLLVLPTLYMVLRYPQRCYEKR